MGAWGSGTFENDDASDWLYELEESSETSVIAEALSVITDAGDAYLEAPDCSNALAAAEIVAALRGKPPADFPDNAKKWVAEHAKLEVTALVKIAQAAIGRIRSNSELKELWDESEEAAEWYASLDNLEARLT
ncbi:MAG TPA: DUF4259 domain-containing protein [Candidatus Limnocylindria bacterium]|jgi:hypothetical protein|nr:DUF4259 domain-containing protein [Candidatus Limnocylindria bacterium]